MTAATLLLAVILSTIGSSIQSGAIVVTDPALVPDVEQLLCSGDRLEVLVPPGMDLHEYQLTVNDLGKLRNARLIISSGHAPFEVAVRRLYREGELRAPILDILQLEGIRVKDNPATGKPNYHAVLYDPSNYKVFVKALARALGTINPECMEHYTSKAAELAELVDSIVAGTPRLDATAIATSPLAQYAVEWAGIHVKYLIVKEHDSPSLSKDLEEAERAASAGKASMVVVVDPGSKQVYLYARRLAEKHGLTLLVVPSPLSGETVPEVLRKVSLQVATIAGKQSQS